jgi:DNA-binding LacI/PurR family transcriptional regulator
MSQPTTNLTMKELAALAGVNKATVSRALSGSNLVNAETREQILKIAQETGYAINVAARNLRRQTSQTLGIVIPLLPDSGQTISDPFFLEMIGAISHAASQRGYDLIISLPQIQNDQAEQRLLQTGRADGLIVIGQAGRDDGLNRLGPLLDKIVVWGGLVGSREYTLVGSDNFKGGQLAGEHLLECGRNRVLFLGDIQLPEVALRFEGFKSALAAGGHPFDSKLLLPENFGGETSFDAIREFSKGPVDFNAIFAASDVLAMSAILALQSLGKSVPTDVSVVGYDNIGQSALATPPVTTIDQHIKVGGELMVDLLLRKLAGETVTSQTTPTELIIRKSSQI